MTRQQTLIFLTWLMICITMVFGMVIFGGAVRLTGSGLSMVDWRPIMGVIPPIGEVAWQHAFDEYRKFPEYKLINKGMTMPDFQFIFLMEYGHRVLGRVIGLVFFIPFMCFLVFTNLPRAVKNRLWILLLLGGCQGLMGWFMVKSGLVDDPHVSQYRLTAHLMLAVVIFAMLVRLAADAYCSLSHIERRSINNSLRNWCKLVVALVLVMIATGGFMAGTKAGHIFNSWPLMGEQLFPNMLLSMTPWWSNFFENTITIQFVHRWLAILVMIITILVAILALRKSSSLLAFRCAWIIIAVVIFQVGLGISTLVSGVPLVLGVAHQGSALILLFFCVTLLSCHSAALTDSPPA